MDAILAPPEPRVLLNENGETAEFTAFAYRSREGQRYRAYATLSEAIDDFYFSRDREERIKQKSAAIHRVLKNNIERVEKKLLIKQEALAEGARSEEYRVKGEMLTASPHLVKKGMKRVLLPNYYDENCAMLEVELDEKLNAAANAQRYFKLYRKWHRWRASWRRSRLPKRRRSLPIWKTSWKTWNSAKAKRSLPRFARSWCGWAIFEAPRAAGR